MAKVGIVFSKDNNDINSIKGNNIFNIDSIKNYMLDLVKQVDFNIYKQQEFLTCLDILNFLGVNMFKDTAPIVDTKSNLNFIKFKQFLSMASDELCAYLKPQGVDVVLTYVNGYLKDAKYYDFFNLCYVDILAELTSFIGEFEETLECLGEIELNTTLTLASDFYFSLETTKSVYFTILDNINNNFNTIKYKSNLRMVVTDLFFIEKSEDIDIGYDNTVEKLEFIDSLGYEIPCYITKKANKNSINSVIDDIVDSLDMLSGDYPFLFQGILISLNDFNFDLSINFAILLKLGRWQSNIFKSIVTDVTWEYSSENKIPLISIEPITIGDVTISSINLNYVYDLMLLDIAVGSEIKFKYVKCLGVLPLCEDNRYVILE